MTTADVSPAYLDCTVLVGGIKCAAVAVLEALAVLRAAPGMMIRQPLHKAGNPLAACDYHAVAAPYRDRFAVGAVTGRGAAGRHIAKQAFCMALEELLSRLGRLVHLQALAPAVSRAWAMFSEDSYYAAEMAASAVQILTTRHRDALKERLQQAAHQAESACEARRGEFTCDNESPCGTGACRFAPRALVLIAVTSVRGAGRRPANHERAGSPYSALDGLAELVAAEPLKVVAS